MIQYFCDRCGEEIQQAKIRYTVKMELYASRDKVYFTEADLQKDHRAEMEKLIKQMESMDPEELTDEVYVRYEFDLCGPCRKRIYGQFKQRQPLQYITQEYI